jgi:hypothetical protein
MEGNDKVKLNTFGLNIGSDTPQTNYNLVTINRDTRATTEYNRINFTNEERQEYRERKQPEQVGIQLNFEGNAQFNRNKGDEVYHYGNLMGNVMKSLGITTPVRKKVDISVDYTPNSTIANLS